MVTTAFIAAALDPESDDIFALLVTIDHASLATPIRVCSGGAALTSNSRAFTAYPFELMPPGESDGDVASRGRLRIENVSTDIIAALRQLSSAPSVTLELVLAAAPNTIEKSWRRLRLLDPAADAAVVEVELSPRDFSEESFPKQRFTPGRTPAAF